jgi:hypothetical protein
MQANKATQMQVKGTGFSPYVKCSQREWGFSP